MMPLNVRTKIAAIIDAISAGHFAQALAAADASRVSEAELRNAVADYGRTLVQPATSDWDVMDMTASDTEAWSIRAPLSSKEERRSDLEVMLSASLVAGEAYVALDDILVP